jgi:patatin-like phospholipase/acyl hydrolase
LEYSPQCLGERIWLLALDGGSVRGLSSLMTLQQPIVILDPPKPWEYFDMIGGTSTGGLIAIMLGRLRERISET